MIAVLPAEKIRAWDQFTIEQEPIASHDLMDRAAQRCTEWLRTHWNNSTPVVVFCGTGNNGGDGLAIARHLLDYGYTVSVLTPLNAARSADNQHHFHELHSLYRPCLQSIEDPWHIAPKAILVDALFGTGLQRPLQGKEKEWVDAINQYKNTKISIDLPSGLAADQYFPGSSVVEAQYTLTFQCYKKSLLFAETGEKAGQVSVLDIGLHPAFLKEQEVMEQMMDLELASSLYRKRARFAHKGTYGHTLLFNGSKGKMGASILAAKACLRSGSGLVSVLTPDAENPIIQSTVPEAMSLTYQDASLLPRLDMYQSIAAGCGLGQSEKTAERLLQLISESSIPLILDADALNLIAMHPEWLNLIAEGSMLTPHPKEFDRLFGYHAHSFDRYETQRKKAMELKLFILLKGHHSCLCTPDGQSYFGMAGNPGMATGGSGDVLTGILAGLQAQYRHMLSAGLLGLFLHGAAGDVSAAEQSEESLIASDLIENLGKIFSSLCDSVAE